VGAIKEKDGECIYYYDIERNGLHEIIRSTRFGKFLILDFGTPDFYSDTRIRFIGGWKNNSDKSYFYQDYEIDIDGKNLQILPGGRVLDSTKD
jgi:hypothetical protein